MALLLQKVAIVSLAVLLTACSTDQASKREALGDDDYLKTPALSDLKVPAGMVLPLTYGDFVIPKATTTGALGKAVDIRPPEQVIQLLAGARVQVVGNTGSIILENSSKNQNLWAQVEQVLAKDGQQILSQENQVLITEWINWPRLDEKVPYRARYEISLKQVSYQQVLTVRLGDLRHVKDATVTNPDEISRYTIMMVNSLIAGLNQLQNSTQIIADNTDNATLLVQSATDDTGLPMLIVRGAYNTVWSRLPAALESVGITSSDGNRSQGTLSLKYKGLNRKGYEALGITDPQLKSSDYLLQVGDLDNRTSLQFRDSKGKPLSEEENTALLEVMQAAFSQNATAK